MKKLLTTPLFYVDIMVLLVVYSLGRNVIPLYLDYGVATVMIGVAVIFISCFLFVGGLYLATLRGESFNVLVFVLYFSLALLIVLLGFLYVEYVGYESPGNAGSFTAFVVDTLR